MTQKIGTRKIYFMPFSFYCANYTACSESNSLASSLSSGQGPVFAIWKCIRNCPSAFLYFMYWEDQTIYYELYHKILKPKKRNSKININDCSRQASTAISTSSPFTVEGKSHKPHRQLRKKETDFWVFWLYWFDLRWALSFNVVLYN